MIYHNVTVRGRVTAAVAAYDNETNDLASVGLLTEHILVNQYIPDVAHAGGVCIITVKDYHIHKVFYLELGGWVRAIGDVTVTYDGDLILIDMINLEEFVIL